MAYARQQVGWRVPHYGNNSYDPLAKICKSKVTVRLYIDFDGCISALPVQPGYDDHNKYRKGKPYTIDKSASCGVRYSSELLEKMRHLLDYQALDLTWLTSNQDSTDWINSILGFYNGQTRTLRYIDSQTLRPIKGGKVSALYNDLTSRNSAGKFVVWIDDDYARPKYCRRLKKLIADLNIRMIAIQPNPYTGLDRDDMAIIEHLIKCPVDFEPGTIKFVGHLR